MGDEKEEANLDHKKDHQKQDIIDEDLYEDFSDEEMYELVQQARVDVIRSEHEEEEPKKPKSRFPKWVLWILAIALVFRLFALFPDTFSIPALKFLASSASLSSQADIKEYKNAVVVIETEEGKGTGFAYSEDGKILTNYHVVEGYDKVTITFKQDGFFVGDVVHTFPEIDLAVVEIEEDTQVPALDLADSFTLKSDEEVYFIGNPLKFTGIANQGTVLDYVNIKGKQQPVVMMDAPVYRGNSGSPVINKSGAVIGVVFATMFHDDEGRVGLFIPIDYFYESLLEKE